MAVSPLHNNMDIVTFDILIEGKKIPDEINVISINTKNQINKISSAKIVIRVDHDKINSDLAWFPVDKKINIKAGYNGKNQPIFEGTISTQNLEGREDDRMILTITCTDALVEYKINPTADLLLTLGHDVHTFFFKNERKKSWTARIPNRLNRAKSPQILTDKGVSGKISFIGSSLAKVNSLIELKGFGKHFGKDGFINKVEQVLKEGKWTTIVGLGVKKKWLEPKEEPVVITVPEPSLFHNLNGYEISVNEEDRTLNIKTPNANQLVFSDEERSISMKDVNGNEFLMNDSGIKIKSISDLELEADGEISLNAGRKVKIDADGNVDVEGLNVRLHAQVELKAEGNASAELSAAGNTTVKGSMVMIN